MLNRECTQTSLEMKIKLSLLSSREVNCDRQILVGFVNDAHCKMSLICISKRRMFALKIMEFTWLGNATGFPPKHCN